MSRSLFLFALIVSLAGGITANVAAQNDPSDYFREGYELLQRKEVQRAIERFEQGLKSEPNNALAHFYLAEAYLQLRQNDKAKIHYKKSLQLDPNGDMSSKTKDRLNLFAQNGIQKSAADSAETDQSQPTAAQTVDFINGLYACAPPYAVFFSNTAKNDQSSSGEINSRAAMNSDRTMTIEEHVHYEVVWADRSAGEPVYFQGFYHKLNTVRFDPKKLAAKVEPDRGNSRNISLNCNPQFGACLQVTLQDAQSLCGLFKGNDKCRVMTLDEVRREPLKNEARAMWTLNFCSEDAAVRGAKAMSYLIKSSGGKESLF